MQRRLARPSRAGLLGAASRVGIEEGVRVRAASSIVCLAACSRAAPPPGDDSPPPATPSVVAFSTTEDAASSASDGASASDAATSKGATIDLALAGDAIPQVKVLANDVAQIFSGAPSCWSTADARVFNLEAPIGERKDLPGDKSLLAFASPPKWVGELFAASRADAFVVANNHSCDLGPQGLAATVDELSKIPVSSVGASKDDPWARVVVADKEGRRVCVVAWTTFVNDAKGTKQHACIAGESGTKLALAELGKKGVETLERELAAPGRWDGCDARVAFVHGGGEYKPQIRPVLEQMLVASAYVDAIVVTHPHVPDVVESIVAPEPKNVEAAGGRSAGRGVPLYRSLGNFVSNQGIGWSMGMSVDLLSKDDAPDPIHTVWTRVGEIARLRFGWSPDAPPNSPPTSIAYGYTLTFSDRSGEGMLQIRMRPLPNAADDAVAARLRKAPKPFGALLDDPCRIDADAPPSCDASKTSAVAKAP